MIADHDFGRCVTNLANPHFDAELNDSKDTVRDENDASGLQQRIFDTITCLASKLDVFTRGFSARTVVHQGGGEPGSTTQIGTQRTNSGPATGCIARALPQLSSKRKPSSNVADEDGWTDHVVDPVHVARSSIGHP